MHNADSTREEQLQSAIRDLYLGFRSYHLGPVITPDTCFPDSCDERPLRAAPLQLLPTSAFRVYQWKAITTWGSVSDFKHFLPRVCELLATRRDPNDEALLDPFIIFSKLSYAHWQQWPVHERLSLERYFAVLWKALLIRPMETTCFCIPTGHLLKNFAYLALDISSLLQHWEDDLSDPVNGLMPAAHLSQLITSYTGELAKKQSLDWQDSLAKQEQQVLTWLASQRVAALMESAFFRWSETPYAELLSDGQYWLAWWRNKSK